MLHAGGEFNGTHAGIGIKGYDPVAYFTTGAWGVAEKGRLFDVDPEGGWTIHDGRLYLNFNAQLNAVFREDAAGFAARAAGKWPALNR